MDAKVKVARQGDEYQKLRCRGHFIWEGLWPDVLTYPVEDGATIQTKILAGTTPIANKIINRR